MSAIQSTTNTSSNPAQGTVAPVQSSVGPVSGINYQTLITELVASQQQQVTDLQNDITSQQTKQGDYETLAANLTTLATSLQTLGTGSTFQNYQVQMSDPNQLNVTATSSASPGFLPISVAATCLDSGFRCRRASRTQAHRLSAPEHSRFPVAEALASRRFWTR